MKLQIIYTRILKYRFIHIIMVCLLLWGCEDFLEPETPLGQIENEYVFNDKNTAIAAVTSLYGKLRDDSFLSGGYSGAGFIMGLYADELDYYSDPGSPLESFYLHQILPSNNSLKSVWEVPYNIIFATNGILEGIEASTELPQELKNQLRGEALFVRGLCHFYLVNYFGDIPYISTTNYIENSKVRRLPSNKVYENIITDLTEAKNLLGNEYISSDRVRPNKMVISSLLSRVYLYRQDWNNAALESSNVINNSSYFAIEPDLNKVFLKESSSTIWQFRPKYEGDYTLEGSIYIFTSAPPPLTALNSELVLQMEQGDLRRINWIGEVSDGSEIWYFPYKYKQNDYTTASAEYSIVFRLEEQFLIRAEARAMLGDISGAQLDLNKIRNRAGLQNTQATTSQQLKEAVIKERKVELFTEFGHRWFDLRRTGKADEVLSPIKSGWRNTDVLLPIPESELTLNPNLNPQNPGY
ncbi:RagB/SusD family nutrient uptake outer membrane protein [Aequorivita viscosa]|uniref:RagB/SusD domain-containing protein n=1 Tax=Aequorivita viscosa TaxID=797419 RepID=A0A1M6MI57_9FLAO|nr:RagB/SusD family nutrient uptake outer membrane protein [Aequorivita viscosa]SDX33949.1 RagB/SusD domain-containing protein [Aequorivita viscosa]SHJ83000.1 RagB/SusD domain-containing protein [Aequorivita viscosa]